MVFLKEKLGFRGPGEAPERRKARPFPGGAPGAPRESLLQDFGVFWPPSGVPRGARFPLVSVFSGASKPTKKRAISGSRTLGTAAEGRTVWGPGKTSLSEKSMAKH